MWNPFKKSKLKQLAETVAEAANRYIVDSYEAYIKKLLLNKDVDITNLNKFLASESLICVIDINDTYDFVGFINNYTYDIKKIDNDEYVIIDGKLIILKTTFLKDLLNEINTYVTICIGDKNNNVVCNCTIGSVLYEKECIYISLIINVPIKEVTTIDK